MSILRRLQRGYADPLPIEMLPILLTNTLGDLAVPFGAQLVACMKLSDEGGQVSRLSCDGGGCGHTWLGGQVGRHCDGHVCSHLPALWLYP